jgi:ATP-dependent Clp protease protease subunit|tara:strand:- start:1640 stop:2320 length:681 start_codon:yes stop_codon:yes gene_type:complete
MNDFEKYTKKHLHINNGIIESYQKVQSILPNISSSVTPTIIEERQLNVAAMSVFDRLMMDRIIWCAGPVDDRMAITVQAQLLFLSQKEPKKTITMHIDSPGGSVKAGLSMIDVMSYIESPIQTINTGMAASMGSLLLGAGTKGMRSSLKHSRTMLHQSSGGAGGNIQDARIMFDEWEKINKELFELLGGYCGKTAKRVEKDAQRDLWLSSSEALDYGIIDEVIIKK